jgi:hypothetical protein
MRLDGVGAGATGGHGSPVYADARKSPRGFCSPNRERLQQVAMKKTPVGPINRKNPTWKRGFNA